MTQPTCIHSSLAESHNFHKTFVASGRASNNNCSAASETVPPHKWAYSRPTSNFWQI